MTQWTRLPQIPGRVLCLRHSAPQWSHALVRFCCGSSLNPLCEFGECVHAWNRRHGMAVLSETIRISWRRVTLTTSQMETLGL